MEMLKDVTNNQLKVQVLKTPEGAKPFVVLGGKKIFIKKNIFNKSPALQNPLKTTVVRPPISSCVLPAKKTQINVPAQTSSCAETAQNNDEENVPEPLLPSVVGETNPPAKPSANNPPKKPEKKTTAKKGKANASDKVPAEPWTDEQILETIMSVKAHSCLYNVKDSGFMNRLARLKAWEQCAFQVSLFRNGVNGAEVKKKWHSLRTQFMSEEKETRESKGTGSAADKVYVPTMRFYQEIVFLKEYLEPRRTVDNLNIDEGFDKNNGDDDILETMMRQEELDSVSDDPVEAPKKLPGPPIKKRKPASTDSEFLQVFKEAGAAIKAIASNDSTKPTPKKSDDHFNFVGSYVASTLRSMAPEKAEVTEKSVMAVLLGLPH